MAKKDELDYRAERKKRLAKKNKGKAALSDAQLDKLGKIIGIVIAAGLCVALVCGLFSFFGVSQKLTTAVKVGDEKFSAAEYNYFYTNAFMNVYNTAYQYDSQYGAGMGKLFTGYDMTVAPDEQTIEVDAEQAELVTGEETAASGKEKILYTEYFRRQAIESMEQYAYYLGKAKEAGIELSADDKAEIEENINYLKDNAKNSQVSLGRYIVYQYGKGLNEKSVRKLLGVQLLVTDYLNKVTDDIKAGLSEDEINKTYEDDKNAYNSIDMRIFAFPLEAYFADSEDGETAIYTDAEQEARAAEFKAGAKDEASFTQMCVKYADEDEKEDFEDETNSKGININYDTIKNNAGEDGAKWAFDAARKAGDVEIFKTDKLINVVMISKPVYRNEVPGVDVRHILITFGDGEPTDDVQTDDLTAYAVSLAEKAAEEGVTGEDVIDDAGNAIKTVHGKKSEYLAQIGKIYTEWKNGDATEESFAELADKYSEDTASTTNGGGKGGLIENVQIGQTVKPFEDWSFDSARKAGDVEIVESSYGYHLMYYVAAQEEPQWKMNIKTTLAEAQLDEIAESAEAEYKGTAQTGAGEGIAFKAAVTHVLDLHDRYRGN